MDLNATQKAEIVRAIFEEGWNRAEFDTFAPYLADDILFHWRSQRIQTNLDDLQRLVGAWRAAFPDLRFEVLDVVAAGDRVAANLLFSGTQKGPWGDLPPSGRTARVREMMFFRFEGGLLVELWEVFDEWALRQQLTADEQESA